MHIRRRMTNTSAILGLVAACTTALALLTSSAYAAPSLTGRVNVDFAVPGAFNVPDDSIGRDVGLPLDAPLGTVSGWDMSSLRLFYDPATDVLYVGIQTFGIGGDADGDGDEGTTSAWLGSVFGADLPLWQDTESFALMLDIDEDGIFDVIAGVPATGDLTTYTVAQFDGLTSLPGFAFGAPLGDQFIPANPVVGPATFVAPHIEFRITSFSQLPGFDGTVGPFRAKAFMGSLEDSGIGEDRIPNGNDTASRVCLDSDGDGYSTCDGDCDDSNPAASPGNLGDPLCDLVDEDCDGETDEDFGGPGVETSCGFSAICQAVGNLVCVNGIVLDTCMPGDNGVFVAEPTVCGLGACAATGTTTCATGSVTDTCTPGVPAAVDVCNGIDDDCDGVTDEGFLADVTTCGVGVCQRQGLTTCIGGVVGDTCVAGEPAQFEVCNGLDDTCNGATDDSPVLPNPPSCGLGECATVGTMACVAGEEVGTCVPPAGSPEQCDGLDNDCDGAVDNDPSLPPAPTCGVGQCATIGSVACESGSVVSLCVPPLGVPETCDGLDNDCNGAADDGIAPVPTACGVGECAASGELVCAGGALVDSCVAGVPSSEVCDGADNNCDGSVDEGIDSTPTSCGVGACAAVGELICTGGGLVDTCASGTPSTEICDGVDNNCDGSVDEGLDPTPTSCGVGACAATGELACTGGSLVDTCAAGTPSAEVCDGVDNNCDGSVDEGIAPTPTSCGAGACAASGELVCEAGTLVDTCVSGQPGTSDSCDGVDNNCDGITDEDFVSEPTTCGLSGCAATGATTCIGGVIGDSCTPGTPGLGDPFCDGIDDDCDGETDEDFGGLGIGTTCGSDLCASEGVLECVNGEIRDTCVPGPVTGDDADCDGIDNDCDGETDESFAGTPTACGVGACAGNGVTTCSAGVVSDTCMPGAPTGADDDCDGIDDDCDGFTDEGFSGEPTSCGVGACASTGATTCVNGAVVDTCAAGAPTGGDADCDGTDNDCDGATDESFVGAPTSCGIGACGSTGATTCVAGVVGDSCSPGSPTGGDADCDGTDNDCDGATDESFVSEPTACGVGVCAAAGNTTCSAGIIGDTCAAGAPTGGDADCDGTDNDCDGATDESFVGAPTSCGIGACGSTGATTCVAGVVGDSCSPGSPTGDDADCDGTDNDCDGATDESFVSEPTSCGTGACASTGVTNCVAGVIGDSCSAGTPGAMDGCDGVDNDCDGATDEDFVGSLTSCGTGACASTGTTTCSAGVVGDTCSAGAPTGDDADCDGVDNNCDGSTDESFVGVPTSCGTGVCASSGQTVCAGGVVSDSCAPGNPNGRDSQCDGLDNDCDGDTDEAFVDQPTTCGAGACSATGTLSCVDGVVSDSCTPGAPGSTVDTCDGVDNDCDGATDEDFVSEPTECGTGACLAMGTTTCIDGVVGDSCVPGTPGLGDPICDGVDDDCDGQTDEDFGGIGIGTTCGAGICASEGTLACIDGQVIDTCTPGPVTGDDSDCDLVDNDCDGLTDESFVNQPTTCGVGACAGSGATSCTNGVVSDSCSAGTPTGDDADCDGVDNDCDGETDENFVSAPTSCGTGACASTGMTACVAGVISDSCSAGTPGVVDGCDGVDNDCDGATDEDFVGSPTSCGTGACASLGTTTCVAGVVSDTCSAGAPTGDDADCDGVDNDCDGSTDESFVSEPTSCGVGVCAATGGTTCSAGVIGDTCSAGAPTGDDADCDGVDNDCDGSTDESFVSEPTSCGVGACASTGGTTCSAGVIGDTCSAGTPGVVDGCDGVDNDCDGATDEDFVGGPTSCGTGACASLGTTTCVAGVVGDTCSAGAPTGDDADCDGVDNDCDGSTDESFVSEPTSCGVGACASTGGTTCSAGVIGDTCSAGTPGVVDGCDGVDNDCDGATDEDFVGGPTSCGTGACASLGTTTCVAGVVGDTCSAGAPTGDDADCDGVDNDCDGATDEDFVSAPTSCGTGACASTGMTACVAGVISDSCSAGTPGVVDGCDGVDNDCDGATDEDFVGSPTSCGTGACASLGTTTCVAGVVGDTCSAGAPTGDDADCDGVDNDCDGATDEDFVSEPTSCGVGVCASIGATTCSAGVIGDTCSAGTPGVADDCDGVDNDCDGATDEDFVSEPTSCGVGVCASIGATTCSAGVIGDTCTAGRPTGNDADCDGVDNDCDGETDEAFVSEQTNCGLGVCAARGLTLCTNGQVSDTCSPGAPIGSDNNCDSIDDDCDGSTDESFVGQFLPCGVGVCANTSQVVCIDGATIDTCVPGLPTGDDADCDGVDNNCNGFTDESFVGEPTSCGVGVCAATGTTTCTSGVITDGCFSGAPTGCDDDCDGLDNDCDGSTDESFVGAPTSCGEGVCHSDGVTTCTGGVVEDSCTEGAPTGDDADCDGVDNNCDGFTDESFVSEPTSCGTGVCAARGATTCDGGVIGDSCAPGRPTSTCDDDCNGLDDDCDGSTDEAFAGVETYCGVGVCANRGLTTCVDGVQSDTCAPGDPIGPDTNCDSMDDDCDGSTDESFVGEFLPCGVGACATTSQVVCTDGATVDTCRPLPPAGADDNCNGIDDNCDGSVDEAFVAEQTSCGEGACYARGMTYCVDGGVYDTCVAGAPRPDANCNGVDDDCDGETDEAFQTQPTTCGEGECYNRGMTACVAGAVVDTCEPLAPTDEICEDGIDQDCDGQADDGCECPAPAPGLVYAVASAHSDECHGGNDMHAISLPGFFDGIGTSDVLFSFNDDALFEWSVDGLTARVSGSATLTAVDGDHAYELGSQWWVDVVVHYRGAGAFGEGTGGPVLALAAVCQPPSLTSAWDYFDMLDGDALISRFEDPTDFAVFTMFPVGGVHPMQLGYAANNKNANMGLSAGLEYVHYKADGCATTNTGAISVDLDCP